MTEHVLKEHTLEDQATMRRLAVVIGCFIGFTAVLALTIGIIAG